MRDLSILIVGALFSSLAFTAKAQSSDDGVIVVEIRDVSENVPIANAYVLLHNNFGAREPTIRRTGPGRFEISGAGPP